MLVYALKTVYGDKNNLVTVTSRDLTVGFLNFPFIYLIDQKPHEHSGFI